MKIEIPLEKDDDFMKRVKNLVLDTMRGILRKDVDDNDLLLTSIEKYFKKNNMSIKAIVKECIKEMIAECVEPKRNHPLGGWSLSDEPKVLSNGYIAELVKNEVKLQLFNKMSKLKVKFQDE